MTDPALNLKGSARTHAAYVSLPQIHLSKSRRFSPGFPEKRRQKTDTPEAARRTPCEVPGGRLGRVGGGADLVARPTLVNAIFKLFFGFVFSPNSTGKSGL